VNAPLLEPDAGLTVSHEALSLALQFRVPEPVLDTVMVWLAGLAPPWMAEKESAFGVKSMTGTGAAVTVNDTRTDCGLLVEPTPVTVIGAV